MATLAIVVVAAVVAVVVASYSGGVSRPRAERAAVHRRAPVQEVSFTVEASGDLLIHSPVFDRALELGGGRHYDFTPMFARIKPYIESADLPLCHVETPMTPAPPHGYPVFNTPPDLASSIRATGWRACSTAATHSLDEGQTGIDDTNRALDRAGVLHTGEFSSAATARTPLIIPVKGIPVAFLAYTELTNGIPSPHPWSVVNIHWGDEYVSHPSDFQMNLARQLTASPYITAIVGQHVHVPQPIRRINGKLVVFGEGNLISNQTADCCASSSEDGMIALVTITVDSRGSRVAFIHYVPIWVRHPDYVVLPAGIAWRTDPADAPELRASYRRTVATVGRGPQVQPIPASLG